MLFDRTNAQTEPAQRSRRRRAKPQSKHFTDCPKQEVGFGPKSRGTDGKPTDKLNVELRFLQHGTDSVFSSDTRHQLFQILPARSAPFHRECFLPHAQTKDSARWRHALA